jgi:flavin reductase (DIM6/NTAB) family NADH-FMN oxidoreductase RutF
MTASTSHATLATLASDPRELRRTCGAFATGVTVIGTRVGGVDYGMTANSFMSVSLEPPLIAISIGRRAKMLRWIEATGRYAVSILAEDMMDVALHFAGRPRRRLEPQFVDFAGLPVIRGAIAQFAARVHDAVPAGDHVLFIGKVEQLYRTDGRPLIFHNGHFGTSSRGSVSAWGAGASGIAARHLEEAPELW